MFSETAKPAIHLYRDNPFQPVTYRGVRQFFR